MGPLLETLLQQTRVRVVVLYHPPPAQYTPSLDLNLSIAPNATLQGTVEGHVIPTVSNYLDFGAPSNGDKPFALGRVWSECHRWYRESNHRFKSRYLSNPRLDPSTITGRTFWLC